MFTQYLTAAATEQVIQAFVTSRLDVGNTVLYRLFLKQIQRLQKVQNWAARLIDGAMKYSHAIPLLTKMLWLPIAVRVEFNNLLLTHRPLTSHAPEYIERRVSRRQSVGSLRSRKLNLLCVPRTRRHFQRGSPKSVNVLSQHQTIIYTTAAFIVKL